MSPRVVLVDGPRATQSPALLAARLRALGDAGWDAHLLRQPVPQHPPRLPPRPLLRRPAALARYLAAPGEQTRLDGRLLELRPDLVHFHSGPAAWKAMRLKPLLGCRIVVSFRDDGRDLDNYGLELLWEHADLVLFPDAAVRDRAVGMGCPHERAEVLPAPLWTLGTSAPGRGSGNGRLELLSAGPMIWEQGFEHSVHAVRLLLDMGVRCRYRIIGEGEHLYAVSWARRQLGLDDHVDLLRLEPGRGVVEELERADVYVDPAVTATTSPVPLLTARALGVPFVATARQGLPDGAGIAVPRRDPGALARALAALDADPGQRARLGRAGRAGAAALPTLDDDGRRLDELYRRALA